jgi:hypothetical protein
MRARGPLHASADEAVAAGAVPPFDVRPGLVAEMLRFTIQLRRQGRSVDRFEELLVESLGDTDRGAARLLDQTRFLATAFAQNVASATPSTSMACESTCWRPPPPIRCGTSS